MFITYIIYIINHNSFWISNLSLAIYDWNSFDLIQQLRFHLILFFFLSKLSLLYSQKCGPHIGSYSMVQKPLKMGIYFINLIIFLVESTQKKLTYSFLFYSFLPNCNTFLNLLYFLICSSFYSNVFFLICMQCISYLMFITYLFFRL